MRRVQQPFPNRRVQFLLLDLFDQPLRRSPWELVVALKILRYRTIVFGLIVEDTPQALRERAIRLGVSQKILEPCGIGNAKPWSELYETLSQSLLIHNLAMDGRFRWVADRLQLRFDVFHFVDADLACPRKQADVLAQQIQSNQHTPQVLFRLVKEFDFVNISEVSHTALILPTIIEVAQDNFAQQPGAKRPLGIPWWWYTP